MALSNWDTMAVDKPPPFRERYLTSPLGVSVSIYKNWLYVRDAHAWQEGGAFIEPTVMEVQEGNLCYKDLKILAFRGPQEGVYVAAWSGWTHLGTLKGMVGCGVYGYEGETFVGVQSASAAWLQERLTGDEYRHKVPKELRNVLLSKSELDRFNQGDAFFAKHLGVDTPATGLGEVGPPVLEQALKEIKKS